MKIKNIIVIYYLYYFFLYYLYIFNENKRYCRNYNIMGDNILIALLIYGGIF